MSNNWKCCRCFVQDCRSLPHQIVIPKCGLNKFKYYKTLQCKFALTLALEIQPSCSSSDQKGCIIMSYTLKGFRADAYPKLQIGHDRAKNLAIENSDIFGISQSDNLYTSPWCTKNADFHRDGQISQSDGWNDCRASITLLKALPLYEI